MKKRLAVYSVLLALAITLPLAWADDAGVKRIAVLPIRTAAGIVQFWEGNFNPGEAMTAIVQNQLTKSNRYAVFDRRRMAEIAQEQNLGVGGQVTPETAAKVGQLTGVQYLLDCTITQFAATKASGVHNVAIPGIPVFGGGGSKHITVQVEGSMLNVNTSQISAGLTGQGDDSVTNFSFGGYGGGGGATYESQDFENSGLGKAMYRAAENLVAQMDTVQFKDLPATPTIEGVIIDAEGGTYTLNVGKKDGVFKGMKFTVSHPKVIVDVTTGKQRVLHTPLGTITVTAVEDETCTCKAGPSSPPFKVKDSAKLER